MTSSNSILGIDFGTTNSTCAIMDGTDPKIIVNNEGERTTPSVVAFDDGERLVGKPAKNQAVKNPEETIASIKRHIGETHYTVTLDDAEYTPGQVSGMILEKIKRDAEAYVGDNIEKIVMTVPAYFNDRQRQAIKDAGETAGFEVERIINEPSAASMAYGLGDESDQTVLVCDLGGGSFSAAVLDLGGSVYEVVATNGDNSLGGDDWDRAIIDHLADDFEDEHGIDLRKDEQALARLKDAAEKAKIELSSRTETTITLLYIATDEDGRKDLETSLTRAKFESLTADLLERVEDPTKQALADADHSTSDIDEVILVGGATRMPMVQDKIGELTGKEPKKNVNPDEAVALGAAIQGGVFSGKKDDIVLLDVTPLSLGVKVNGGLFEGLIEKNTTIPTEESEVFTTAADNQTSVQIRVFQGEREIAQENEFLGSLTLNDLPETQAETTQIEVTFAIDANGILRVEAAEMETDRSESIVIEGPPDEPVSNLEPPDTVLQEDTPLSIGVEVDDGLFERIIPKNSFIPAEESKLFTTAADDQTDVQLRVFCGEREIAAENELLGEFTLTDIPPAPAGTPEIEVECSVAENGTIDLAAEEQTSGNQVSIIIKEDANLSDSKIEKLLEDAEEHAQKDQERRQEIIDGNMDADLSEAKSLPARCPSGTDQLTKTDELIEALAGDGPPEFKGESVLVEVLADGAVDFESEEEFLEALVEMAIRIDDQETLLNELTRGTTGFREPEDIRTTLHAIVEASAEVEKGRDFVETVVEDAMDVRNDLHRGYHYYRRNSQSASAIEDSLQGTGDKIQKIFDQSPGIIRETKASDATVRQLYRTLEAIQDRLQRENVSMAELKSTIEWLDESFAAVGCTIIDPEIESEPDPYQHQVWTTTESDLPEGKITRIEEVGYERDGEVKQEAKVVVSEGRLSDPQIDAGTEKIPSLQAVRSPPRRILSLEDLQTTETLGHGGQTVIEKVRLPDNKTPPEVVALREPAASETMSSETVEEFLERAETWVKIDARERDKRRWEESEYIVGVIDTGDDYPWIAMEYMKGGDLTELLEDYPDGLPVGQALWIGECICKGLEIAHQLGRVHLDVKPGNVLLKQTGGWPWPKLANWGLARTLARETGTVQELSVEYASPEQFDSSTFGDPDQLTDIYQTGTLIYALLTGAPPVTGSQFEVMQQVMSEEAIPAPSERRAELPAAVDAAIGLALEQDKTERYDSITEFRKAVQAIRTDERLPRAVATRLGK